MMKRTSPRVVFASTLILIAFAVLILQVSGYLTPITNVFIRPVTALQSWFAIRYIAVRDLLASPNDMATMRDEINQLQAENALLQQEIIALREQASEAEVLAALLDYARAQPASRYLATNVIGRDISPFIRSILIGQGSDIGITVGMPVVTAQGLVGRVEEVFSSYARVQLITDPETAVNVKFQQARTEGILSARLNGEIFVDLIDLNAELIEGELVLTSGLGGKYPPDIPVGSVTSIRRRDFDLFQDATIQSSVSFEELSLVLVITNFEPLILESVNP
jgi:rod shape-determining protein MreC